jgi:arginyl-tRNA synthetase
VVPLDEKGLTDHPLLIEKADGAKLYGTTDLATIEHRRATWNPDRVLYLVDTRQQLHFRQVFAAARKMGFGGDYVHVWFGMLKFPSGAVVSTRGGGVTNLVDVLDTAAERALVKITEKSPHLPERERRAIAEVVGTGTIKYFDLSQNPQSDITFDWDRALSDDGGSAVYLQYAYARLHSILRSGGAAETPPDVAPAHEHPAERALLRLVARLPEAVEAAAETCKPNLLAEALETLARGVGPFYESCPVLKDGVPPEVRAARLALVSVVARSLALGLDLLGIGVVPRL